MYTYITYWSWVFNIMGIVIALNYCKQTVS